MAVRITESRLPDGFKPGELGQVGFLEYTSEGNPQSPDCYLISYLTSPLCLGFKNTYIVFVTNDNLANRVEEFEFDIEKRGIEGNYKPVAGYKYTSNIGIFNFPALEVGPYKIISTIKDNNGNTLRKLTIYQFVVDVNPEIKSYIDQKGIKIASLGNTDVSIDFYHHYYTYVNSALIYFPSDTKIPSQLLSTLVYYKLWTERKDVIAANLNEFAEDLEIKNYNNRGIYADHGICGLQIPLHAFLLDPNSNKDLSDFFNEMDNNKLKKVKENLITYYKNLSESQKVDIFNLVRFPKTNIRLCYLLLNSIKESYSEMDNIKTDDFFSNSDAVRLLLWDFVFIEKIYSYQDFLLLNYFSEVEAKKIEKYINKPFINILDKSEGYEANTIYFLPRKNATNPQAQHSDWTYDDTILGKYIFIKSADDDISKGEHYNFNVESEINSIDYDNVNSELILMDVGFWGNYDRDNPQRDFGMIEGKDVWLCTLMSEFANEQDRNNKYTETLKELEGKIKTTELVNYIKDEWNYVVVLKSHTKVDLPPPGATINENLLTIFFPDMHLPEKWPDIPPDETRHTDKEACAFLRLILFLAQTEPHHENIVTQIIYNNSQYDITNTRDFQLDIQNYLNSDGNVPYKLCLKLVNSNEVDSDGNDIIIKKDFSFSFTEFLAEKAILDRRLCINSSWFYSPRNDQHILDKQDERYYSYFRGLGEIYPEMLNCEATPAIDIAVLLKSIVVIQGKYGKENISIIQVGDLYEMWMNNEWLYLDFPYANDPNDEISGQGLIKWAINEFDDYQLRLDEKSSIRYLSDCINDNGWYPYDFRKVETVKDLQTSIDNLNQPYIFNKWPLNDDQKRRITGNNIIKINSLPPSNNNLMNNITDISDAVKTRVQKVYDFLLPAPTIMNSERKNAFQKLCLNDLEQVGKNVFQLEQYKWNKLILELFKEVECKMIYGNHDGYRGDLKIGNKLERFEAGTSFYCNNGIWAEHGHRWDLYNRDGVPIGPAVTNLGYFYFYSKVLPLDKGECFLGWIKNLFLNQYFECTIPGCFRWFSLVNYNCPNELKSKCSPFAVTVVGHSHTPRLVKIKVKKD